MSETHCVTIQIVGTIDGGDQFQAELSALFGALQELLPSAMPHFMLAHPPATVTTFELFNPIPAKRVDWQLSQTQSELVTAARIAVDAIKGDGNGRCRIDARAADRLQAAVERWERTP